MMPLRNSLRRYWLTLLNILKSANVKTRVKSCLFPKGITQFRCFSGVSASFNWKMASSLSVLRPILCREQQPCHRQPRNLSGGADPTALTENGKMQKKVLSADRKAALSRMRQSLPTSGDKRQGTLDMLLPLVRCDRLSAPPCA